MLIPIGGCTLVVLQSAEVRVEKSVLNFNLVYVRCLACLYLPMQVWVHITSVTDSLDCVITFVVFVKLISHSYVVIARIWFFLRWIKLIDPLSVICNRQQRYLIADEKF